MNDLTLAELSPNVKILLHSGAAQSIKDVIASEESDTMMFYSTDCPFKSEKNVHGEDFLQASYIRCLC
jgi:hypothetical protein